jgi:SAM-dependent methyltransferase
MMVARLKRYMNTAITLGYQYRYKLLGIPAPRVHDPHRLWQHRGTFWMQEMLRADPRVTADHQRMSDLFVEELGQVSFQRLLDVGCGYGQRLKPLRAAFPYKTLVGIDFSDSMLHNALVYLDGRLAPLFQADATKMPFVDHSFDAAITWSVLNTMPPEMMRGTLREVRRVMRGVFIAMEEDAQRDTEKSREEHALGQWFFAHDYEAEFAEAGFRLLKVYTLEDLRIMRYTVFVAESP